MQSTTNIKRSVVIGGHATSLSMEDEFCEGLKAIASERQVSIGNLIEEMDEASSRQSLRGNRRVCADVLPQVALTSEADIDASRAADRV